MLRMRLALGVVGLVLLVAAVSSDAASAKGILRLSESGVPVAQGTEVGYSLIVRPEGHSGYAQQVGGGPLSANESKVDGITANEGGNGQAGGWLVDGTIDAIALSSGGKATITESGEAIADNETGGVGPLSAGGSIPEWECFYPLPKELKGTFSTAGLAVVTGTAKAKPSKACHLPGFVVSFTLELVLSGFSGPPLETSLVH